jgi:hypothetical protein
MATTIPDITVQNTAYTNVYTATGIAVGTSVVLQNKGNFSVFLQTTATLPSATSEDGVVVSPLEILTVDAGEAGLFARAAAFSCKLSVQTA